MKIKDKIIFLVLLFLSLALNSFSNTPNWYIKNDTPGGCFYSENYNLNIEIIHHDIIIYFIKNNIDYDILRVKLVRNEYIEENNEYSKLKKYEELKNGLKAEEIMNGNYYFSIKQELILIMNLEMNLYLDENIEIGNKYLLRSMSLYHGKSETQKVILDPESLHIIYFMGITYIHMNKYKKGIMLLSMVKKYFNPYKDINSGLFYLDGLYYELLGNYKLYKKYEKENNLNYKNKYFINSKNIIIEIENILTLNKIDNQEIQNIKQWLNNIWSKYNEYLNIKSELNFN